MNISKRFLHILLILCCLIPIIAILFFLPQIMSYTAGSSNLFWLILLLCPLMHIAMMKWMHKKD